MMAWMASIALAIVGLCCGVVAAAHSIAATRVSVDPVWPRGVEPGTTEASQIGWMAAVIQSLQKSATRTRTATIWAVASVVAGNLSAVIALTL